MCRAPVSTTISHRRATVSNYAHFQIINKTAVSGSCFLLFSATYPQYDESRDAPNLYCFEKMVDVQFREYLLAHAFITQSQSAFMKHHSTQTSLHYVIDSFFDNINHGELTGACLFDLAKCCCYINSVNMD